MNASAELLTLLEERARQRAREELLSFAIYTRPGYIPNWHHRVLCDKLDRFVRGEIKRLMVFMPPRHGKSELVSRCLPAYILGRNPDAQIIAVSYAAELASRMNRDVQRIIDSDVYRQIFTETELNASNVRADVQGSWIRNSDMFEVVGRRGNYRSAGVGGGITGMGCDYALIDDPIKNAEEAKSPTHRERLWEFYSSTLYTRVEGNPGGVLLTITRWNEDDIAGRLIQIADSDPDADQWDVVSFPALSEEPMHELDQRTGPGEPLWPFRADEERLAKIQASMKSTPFVWSAMFQQRPTPAEGGLVKRSWLRYYSTLPELDESGWITSWDMSFKKTKSGSFVVGQVWARSGANFYLVDQFRNRVDFPQTLEAFRRLAKRYPQATTHLVESAANGPAVIDTLKKEIPGIIAISTSGESKESRLSAVSSFIESGNVFLPNPQHHPWVADLVEELVSFPNGRNDDQVDALSQALNRFKVQAPTDFRLDLSIGVQENPWSFS